jgi:hypothetical protein
VLPPGAVEYLPVLHTTQADKIEYVPAGQFAHVTWSVVNLPASHRVHREAPLCEILPSPQVVHVAEPESVLYLPAAHEEHDIPPGPVVPASHWQSDSASLPAGERDFKGHSTHCAEPEKVLNFPASHAWQKEASPVVPASHWQSDSASLPAGELEFKGHSIHCAAPEKFLNFPASHAWQKASPAHTPGMSFRSSHRGGKSVVQAELVLTSHPESQTHRPPQQCGRLAGQLDATLQC